MTSKMEVSIYILEVTTLTFVFITIVILANMSSMSVMSTTAMGLFPAHSISMVFLLSAWAWLVALNLLSMICYSFPVTTSLGFNLFLALSGWLTSMLLTGLKYKALSSVLPVNSPWYLIPFLGLVEVVSVVVRPVTLCFRLLANMSAGHILLTLICKMSYSLWLAGSLFGLLELVVSMVQAFVFTMLLMVYMEEALSH